MIVWSTVPLRQEIVFAFELEYCVICWRLSEVSFLEVSTLVVLLAVLAVVEGLHHLGVLGGGEQLQLPGKKGAISMMKMQIKTFIILWGPKQF